MIGYKLNQLGLVNLTNIIGRYVSNQYIGYLFNQCDWLEH